MHLIKFTAKKSLIYLLSLFMIISFMVSMVITVPESVLASSSQQDAASSPLAIEQGSLMHYFLMGQQELSFNLDVKSPLAGVHYFWALQMAPASGRVTILPEGSHAQVKYLPDSDTSGDVFFNLMLTSSTGESAQAAVIITVEPQPSFPTMVPMLPDKPALINTSSVRSVSVKEETLGVMTRETPVILEGGDAPFISVFHSADYIQGSNFQPGEAITLIIQVEDQNEIVRLLESQKVAEENGDVYFQLDSFDVQPGQTVEITDGTNTQSHVVADLSISEIDEVSKTVSGMTDGSIANLEVSAFDGANWCLQKEPLVGVDSNSWTANFSSCESDVNFAPGTDGWAYQYDAQGNFTQEYWAITAPNIGVNYSDDFIMGFNFLPYRQITLSILGVDWVENSDEFGFVSFQLDPGDVQPGQRVEMTDGTDTQSHVVADIRISGIDKDSKIVTGTTSGDNNNLEVSASSDGENWCFQWAVGDDGTSDWTAVFSDCEVVTFELGTEGWATQYDENRNFSQKYWDLREPYVGVDYSASNNNITGYGFSHHVWVSLSMLGSEWEGLSEWSGEDGNGYFYIDSFDIEPGQTYVLEDSNNNRVEYTVSDLKILKITEETKTVTGSTNGEFRNLVVSASSDGVNYCVWEGPDSDETGDWTADFSSCDDPAVAFEPLTEGWAFQYDDHNNFTQAYWHIPAPVIGVFHSANFLQGFGWTPNAEVSLRIGSFRWGTTADDQGIISFHLDPFNLQPGQTVTITDGFYTQSYDVADLAVTSLDETSHVVSGSKSPNLPIVVTGGGDGDMCYYDLGTDDFDYFAVDFSECLELTTGTYGWVFQYDQRRHHFTQEFWILPSPVIGVYPAANYIQSAGWTPNTEITLSIDSLEWKDKSDKDGRVYFNLDPFDVQPGQTVIITDGSLEPPQYVVANVLVTDIDVNTQKISGSKSVDLPVQIIGGYEEDRCYFFIEGIGLEAWEVDFSECDPAFEIIPGVTGWAYQIDDIGNLTQDFWFVPDPTLMVYPLSGWVVGHRWPPNTEITLSIDGTELQETSNNEGSVYYYTGPDVLEADTTVSMTGGVHARDHTIIDLRINDIDLDDDQIFGTANPNEDVFIVSTSVGFPQIWEAVSADGSGVWEAEFPGLSQGSFGYAWQYDENGNSTHINWYVPNPSIDVFIETGIITGAQWSQYANVTLTIDGEVWHATSDAFGSVFFDISLFAMDPEHIILMTDDIYTIEYQPWQITISEIDIENETISGTAQFSGTAQISTFGVRTDPTNEIEVWACSAVGCLSQYPTLDGSGNWEADFSGVLDLEPGNSGHIKSEDGPKNSTKVSWIIPGEEPVFTEIYYFPLFFR